jgi:UDP-GlcNAc:undecaprenyl-phosphate GlcNAc-1-phosphate transferase
VTLFDDAAALWIIGVGLVFAVVVSIVPRLRSRNQPGT